MASYSGRELNIWRDMTHTARRIEGYLDSGDTNWHGENHIPPLCKYIICLWLLDLLNEQ